MGRFSASASRREAALRAAILMGALTALASPATAQTMIMGGRTGPDVVVNENVLDSLGPPPTLPGLMRQENVAGVSPSGLRPFALHPPRAHRTAAVSRSKTPASERTAQTASTVSRTAIPLGNPRRTAKGKSKSKTQPVEQASAETGTSAPPPAASPPPARPAAPPPPQAATPPAPPRAAAPVASMPAPATTSTPAAPIQSLVRRYPAGTGAAALAAAQPQPPAPTPPAPQAATPAPATSTPPAASTAAPSTPPATPPAPPATPAAAASTTPAPAAAAQPAASASTPPQVAAKPPGSGLPAIPAQVVFAPNVTDMPDPAKATLDKVVTAMKADDTIRVQLVAYASGLPDQANAARRTSLSRAVSVRAYLVEQGVKSVRIDVRAMGNRNDISGPQDRVDIVPIDR